MTSGQISDMIGQTHIETLLTLIAFLAWMGLWLQPDRSMSSTTLPAESVRPKLSTS